MQEPVKALTQSYTRTKAKNYEEFKQTMELHTNSSNNTIFADADGNIAYFHGNFIPKRDPKFDWTKPVDGSDPATEWRGLLSVDETPNLLNPASGWLYNATTGRGRRRVRAVRRKPTIRLMSIRGVESARGLHAVRVLQDKKDFTLDSLIAAAYDSYLPWFEKPIPALIKAWDQTPASDPLKAKTAEQIALLRAWDLRWSATSVPTSLAIFWGDDIQRKVGRARTVSSELYRRRSRGGTIAAVALGGLRQTRGRLRNLEDAVGRDQSLSASDRRHRSSVHRRRPEHSGGLYVRDWGSLASFGARPYKGSKKIYGTSGNSFVAVVEFGKTVRAKAVTAGGESGNPSSPHFNDQAKRYSTGDLQRRVFLPRATQGSHRAGVSSGELKRRSPNICAAIMSSFRRPERLGIPLRLMHGSADRDVRLSETLQLATQLAKTQKEFGVIVFPRENHRLQQRQVERDRQVVGFFRRYLIK